MALKMYPALLACLALAAGPSWAGRCALPEPESSQTLDALISASAQCLREGQDGTAGKIFYAYSIRVRALASMDPSPQGYSMTAQKVQSQIVGPVNRWLGGDLSEWISALEWARGWEAGSRWAEGDALFAKLGASSVDKAAALNNARRAVDKLSGDLSRIDRAAFYSKRKANKLDVRDASFYKSR